KGTKGLSARKYVVHRVLMILAEGKKVEKFKNEHGTPFKDEEGEGVRMTLEDSAVFHKMMKNLNNSIHAFDMTGENAVIGMVSKYDGFLGKLIKQIFTDIPDILNGSEKELKVSDILTFKDFEELKDVLIEKEIETVLRKNHVEQLQWLESKLGVELKKFKLLPDYVEIMERRNLFVHCNGVVSRQYLSECKKFDVVIPEGIKPGKTLDAYIDYVRQAYIVLFQVGVMLGFVLWHKVRPNESEEMIDKLSEVAYDLIKEEEYELGLNIIDFALANRSWAKEIRTAQQLIFRVNKALAFHLRDMQDECEKIADSMDVTAADPVYHLAVAVLKKRYEEAYSIMDKIGDNNDMHYNYKTWPLFNKIRQEKKFVDKFREIYGEEYECNDTRTADFEEVIRSATEMVEKTKEMMAEKEKEKEFQGTIAKEIDTK
ncbi:MAG: hypothetical protein MJY96_06825, partial [Bacteroidaceae bacterium]|nr:hypothetical protein [Bacteroidaceae bacterium]